MPGAVRIWDGGEWEEHVMALLRLHYGPGELVEIPDRDRGDAGLEAYATDGCAYQCYAPQEPLSVEDRYAKQRNKITADLNKFKVGAKVAPLVGTTEIRRWILVTPVVDSRRVVEHCNTKAAEICGLGLSYVAADFKVRAVTDDMFALERAQLLQAGLQELALGGDSPELETRLRFIEENGVEAANLDRKLSSISALADVTARETYAREMVGAYLEGSDGRQRLRDDYPDLARPVDQAISNFRRSLVLRFGLGANSPEGTILTIADELVAEVNACLPGLRMADARVIAHAAIAEWLMDCSLNFASAS